MNVAEKENITWKQKDAQTVTFVIYGDEFHCRGIKQPDEVVKILKQINALSPYEQAQVRYYSCVLPQR